MKIGDRIRLLKKPVFWSSGCSYNCPLDKPFYNGKVIGIITKKKRSTYDIMFINIGLSINGKEYGFAICSDTKDCFQVLPNNINSNIKLI